MQALNEAYDTLRHPERRRRYDELHAAQHSAATATATPQQPTAQTPHRPHLTGAWLSYQKSIGEEIVFRIGHADNMTELLAELQRRIPPTDRRYEINQNRWHVNTAHADVLRALFRNYAPVVQPSPMTTAQGVRRAPPPRRKINQSLSAYTRRDRRGAWMGMWAAVAVALALYVLLLSRLILPGGATGGAEISANATPGLAAAVNAAPVETGEQTFAFPDDCTPARLEHAPIYFREACKTLEHDPGVTTPAPSRPYALTTTRVASNIRSGPDTRFPILTTTPPGARVQLVGYTVSRGYVWYLTNFGGWIRSDLLTESPLYLPMVGAEEMS